MRRRLSRVSVKYASRVMLLNTTNDRLKMVPKSDNNVGQSVEAKQKID